MESEQDYEDNVRRLNAFCYQYAEKLDKRAKDEPDRFKRGMMQERAAEICCLTIPLIGRMR